MAEIKDIPVDLHVEIGRAQTTMADIMRRGRGSLITLDDKNARQFTRSNGDHPLALTANGYRIGTGKVELRGETIHVAVID